MSSHFQVISPIDQSVYCERFFATTADIEGSLLRSARIRQTWQSTPLEQRIEYCQKALDYFIFHAEEIGEELSWQMGRPVRYSPYEITRGFKERAEYMISIARSSLEDMIIEDSAQTLRKISRRPVGHVLCLAPWNYPYLTSVNVIIPALLAGNTVLLKHAQQTPLCAERYAAAFRSAGLPEGVFEYLHISHEQVARVIGDSRIDYVAFTGSVDGGKAIQNAISSRFIHAGLELGGKDPAYVRHDADINYAIENLIDGSFFNSGQSCCGIERIYVHHSIFDPFVEGFTALTRDYILDHPMLPDTTLGPVVRPSAARFIRGQIDEAISQGARQLIDPLSFTNHDPSGVYMAPQVLIDVNHKMRLMTEETFGPVVGIMSVKNDEEAIKMMNDSIYGLTASVWTQDHNAALSLAEQLHTGTCFQNRCDYLDPALAWTGVKNSGQGATLSALGYQSLTRPQSYHMKKMT